MSFHFRPGPGDWLLSNKILDEADDEMLDNVKPSREFDVPYVAGYSKDGKRFYIDRNLPKGFDYEGRFFLVDTPLMMHEVVEKSLLEAEAGIEYQLAHQVALRAEKACVDAARVPWAYYNNWFMKLIKSIGGRASYPDCPPDLDLQPYTDERDKATLKKMFADGKPLWDGKLPPEGK